jgi:hypothetical protein
MNIGDKVRMLHGTEEGIIRRVIDNRMVEVEIEDGFLIPVLKNEIVRIAPEEKKDMKPQVQYFSSDQVESGEKSSIANEGLFLALQTQNNILTAWIVNNTPGTILFSVHQQFANDIKGLSHGIINKLSYAKIDDWSLDSLLNLPFLIVDIIFFESGEKQHTLPYSKKIDMKPKVLQRKQQDIPLISSQGILFLLTEDVLKPDPKAIKQAFFNDKTDLRPKKNRGEPVSKEVDLHIEALPEDFSGLEEDEILKIQISHFEDALEKAVMSGTDQITFIHGVGRGTLRNKIHKFLSQYPHIKYYEDVNKEKFGYGATKVRLK